MYYTHYSAQVLEKQKAATCKGGREILGSSNVVSPSLFLFLSALQVLFDVEEGGE